MRTNTKFVERRYRFRAAAIASGSRISNVKCRAREEFRSLDLTLFSSIKSHRGKSGKRRESSTRGARGSPPRLIADDPIDVDSPILLVRFDSGFGLGPEITVHRPRIGRRS